MIVGRMQRRLKGFSQLNLAAWIRRQKWLNAIYRHFPANLRMAVSQVLARPLRRRVKFQRTSRWVLAESCAPQRWDVDGKAESHPAGAGVNVFAYVRGQFGMAESARLYTRALLEQGYPISVCDIALDIAHSMGDASLSAHIGTDTPYGLNLIFVNPDYLDVALTGIGGEKLANKYTIGCWFWELGNFPEAWMPALSTVDEIMVSSAFVGELVRRVTDKPVFHVPLPVLEMPDSGLHRADFGLRDDVFVFLTSFDFNSFLARKNPHATIEAFRRAFPDGQEEVQLLVKSSNGHRHPERLHELLSAAEGDPRILVRDEVIEREHVQALQRCADAYVSLHRSEGFGLGLAECMRQGKPVIATAWSGNMEFMTADNSCLVNYTLVPVREGEYPHHEGQHWAEPDIEHAAAYMRRLTEKRDFSERVGRQAAKDIRAKLAPRVIAERIVERLETLRSARIGDGPAAAGINPAEPVP